MTLTAKDLKKIADLAYIDIDSEAPEQLIKELNSIMDFVDELRKAPTEGVSPLFHPLAQYQRLRTDEITEENCVQELEKLAPLFEENLYLVPKVLDADN